MGTATAPTGFNWGNYKNEEVDRLIAEGQRMFDPAKQDAILARVHEAIVNDAAYIFVAHDLGPPRAGSEGQEFRGPQSWLIDLTQVTIQP